MCVGVGAACICLWVTVGPSVINQTKSDTQLEKLSRLPDLTVALLTHTVHTGCYPHRSGCGVRPEGLSTSNSTAFTPAFTEG